VDSEQTPAGVCSAAQTVCIVYISVLAVDCCATLHIDLTADVVSAQSEVL
jgi:hypothetical protein